MEPRQSPDPSFLALVRNPVKFRLFLLRKLPAALFSGVRLLAVDADSCTVSVPYRWSSTNPFRSTYFACLSMAAEMSTGILSMAQVYQRSPRVSLLVTAVEGRFHKKATGLTRFICREGDRIRSTVEEAAATGSPLSIRVHSQGFNAQNELVAEFWITWSFKRTTKT